MVSAVNTFDLRLDGIRNNFEQSNENVVECPRIQLVFVFLELRSIGHLLDEHRILILFGARQHRKSGIVTWADD